MGNVTETKNTTANNIDAEIADVLIALSVITRQLAKKITANQTSKEDKQDVQRQALRTDGTDRQSET